MDRKSSQESKLSREQIRNLYRNDYVQDFEKTHKIRLSRLIPLMNLQHDDYVADFGCGNGMLMDLIHDKIGFYNGIDFSQEFINAAKRRKNLLSIKNASFFCESIKDFCARHPQTFDKAFAMDLSEHIYDEDWLVITRAIRTSLKLSKDGIFYLHTPNKGFVIESMKNKGIIRQFPEHIAVRNTHHNINLLKQSGFSRVKVIYLPHYLGQLAWLHYFTKLPVVGKYFKARLFFECSLF